MRRGGIMPRKPKKVPPRVWYGPDKMRAAYYAGQGKSAKEIAQIIGGTDAARVRATLASIGTPLLRQAGGEDALVIRWKRTDGAALEKAAAERDIEPAYLAALIIRKVLAQGPEFLGGLVHEFDVI